ncbi:hypothetical protein [Enterococcus sp. AZ196]|uniref:hypothetical protein n=1 Tax=Enterococcus sp. AZ196 TaxID=2774659 RepID=UPI003D267A7A
MTKKEYLTHVKDLLEREKIKPFLQLQIMETVAELLDYYSVDFVRELLPSLFRI